MLHSGCLEVSPLQSFLLKGTGAGQNEQIKGPWQLESHLRMGPPVEGRHIFGEETCLSALPNNSTLVSSKSFLIVPAGKLKTPPPKKTLTIKMTLSTTF